MYPVQSVPPFAFCRKGIMASDSGQLEKTPLYEQAYQAILRDILAGSLGPGQRLTDTMLAERLGISRTPIREAIRRLENEGILIGQLNRGVWVFRPTVEDVLEIYAIRASVEALGARLAAMNPSRGPHIAIMEEALESARSAVDRGDASDVTACNSRIHEALMAAAGSPHLLEVTKRLRYRATLCRLESLRHQLHAEISVEEHAVIIEQAREGRADAAARFMANHVLNAGARILHRYQEEGVEVKTHISRLFKPDVDRPLRQEDLDEDH